MNPTTLENALRESVQVFPDAKKDNGAGATGFWSDTLERGELLPAWGTRERERWLRWYDRHNYNTLWQGSSSGLVKKFMSTPYEIKGGRNLTHYFDDLTRYAQFDAGFDTFRALWARDYLRFDGGSWFEIIAPGNVMRGVTGRVIGLGHLDSYMCIPTGDPHYPGVYTSRDGKIHLMQRERINHTVDFPDGDQNHPGYGLCALSRAIAVVERQILANRYVVTSLDDKPPPGMLLVGGMTKEQWRSRWNDFKQEQSTDLRPEWGRVITFHGADASLTPTVTPVAFSTPPQNFDYKVYVELDVHEFALAIGVDIQELWELTGGNMGSSGQSQIQHAKSQGKTYGTMLSSFEHAMNNHVLPTSLEFAFKVRDPYEAQERATHAQLWTGIVMQAIPLVGREISARVLASQVEAFGNELYDPNGELIELPDVDPKDPNEAQEVTVDDAAPNAETPTGEQSTVQDSTSNANAKKDFEDTRSAFEANLADLLNAGADEVSRRRAGVVMRAQLNSAGKASRLDGLREGGITALSDADLNAHTVWLAQQSGMVGDFLTDAYKNGLSAAQIQQHVSMWANVSLSQAYYEGVASADANGEYEFTGTDGKESCATCRSLQGRKMRMSEWADKKLRPGVDSESYDCGGYQCKHRLSKVTAA